MLCSKRSVGPSENVEVKHETTAELVKKVEAAPMKSSSFRDPVRDFRLDEGINFDVVTTNLGKGNCQPLRRQSLPGPHGQPQPRPPVQHPPAQHYGPRQGPPYFLDSTKATHIQ